VIGGELKIYSMKMEAILKFLVPTNVTKVRSFIGTKQYLHNFIRSFSTISIPLHAITTSGKSFQWGKNQHKDFDELKWNINQVLVLAFPNLKNPFEVEIDASGYGMGTFLM